MQLSLIPTIFMFYGILSIAYSATLLFYFSKQKNRAIENCAMGAFLLGSAAILFFASKSTPLFPISVPMRSPFSHTGTLITL
jgi:hypothetical protein